MPGFAGMDMSNWLAMAQQPDVEAPARMARANTPMALPEDEEQMYGPDELGDTTPKPMGTGNVAEGAGGDMGGAWSSWISEPTNAMGLLMFFGGMMNNMMQNMGRRR